VESFQTTFGELRTLGKVDENCSAANTAYSLSSPSIFPVATLGKIDGELNEYAVFPALQLACRTDTFPKTLSMEEMLNMLGLLLRVEQTLPPIELTAILPSSLPTEYSEEDYSKFLL
jgi:hypothetical protein